MLYEILNKITFNGDYKTILNLVNSSDKIVVNHRPITGYYIDYNLFGVYKNIVMEFVEIFKANFDEEKVNNMLKNLSTLNITTVVPLERYKYLGKRSVGYYDSKNNEITIETNDARHLKDTLFHELLHMASTREGTNDNYCGFNIYDTIGKGINEDYTEYVLEKYFNVKKEIYPREELLEDIEYLVGEKELENLYFNADMKGLIDELSKYEDKKEMVKLLYEYDNIYEMSYGYKITQNLERRVRKLIAKKDGRSEIKQTR